MGVLQILQKPEYLERHIHLRVIDQMKLHYLTKVNIKLNKITYPYISFIPLNDEGLS